MCTEGSRMCDKSQCKVLASDCTWDQFPKDSGGTSEECPHEETVNELVSPLPLDQYDPALAASARSASRSSSRDRNELEELKVAALFSEKIEVVDEDFNRELTKSFICKGETTAWILKSDVDYNN